MYIKYYVFWTKYRTKKPKKLKQNPNKQQQKKTPKPTKQTTDIASNISHTLDVQQTADSYPPLVVTSKAKTVLNIIWQHSNRWDKPVAEE